MASDQYDYGRFLAETGRSRADAARLATNTAEALRGYDSVGNGDKTETQTEKIARLEAWIADLQNGGYVNCVYCGMRYGEGPDAAVALEPALKAHVEQCPEHPLAKLTARLPAVFAAGYHLTDQYLGTRSPNDERLREIWEEVRDSVLSGEG